MKQLSVKLENCYGIKKLDVDLNFEATKVYSIYATNGSMKTSFTRTFGDLSEGVSSRDLIFPDRTTVREVQDEKSNDLASDVVFVVKPYDKDYTSDKASTLLVNEVLKKKYDNIWQNIKQLEEAVLKKLKSVSGLSKGIDDEVSMVIFNKEGEFLNAIQRLEKEVNDGKDPVLQDVNYKVLFSDKAMKLLDDKTVKAELKEYIERYDELLDQSKYFRKGVFNHTNATNIAKTLVQNGFFDASHTVSFSDGTGKSEISSREDLEKVIETELKEILKDEKLRKLFDKIDKKLAGNQEVRDFREYITEHQEYIPELANIANFKQRIWIDYLKTALGEFNELAKAQDDAKSELKDIRDKANDERTRWQQVVDVFNARFNVPFELSVENQSDVILDGILPSLRFDFYDQDGRKRVNEDSLLEVLSTGEKKALYILNILFEVEARVDLRQETLMIVDDIADSFDYKNKYAIIEYLKDISENDNFYQIVLTHNFDFFRTIQSKYIPRDYCLMVNKDSQGIELVKAEYVENPFKHFMKTLVTRENNSMLLALVPFARNIIEYTKGISDPKFLKLTSMLHIKADTPSATIGDLKSIFKDVFDKDVHTSDDSKGASELFIELADSLSGCGGSLMLEGKIILSVAIRLKAEHFMISAINDDQFVSNITKNQTAALTERYIADNENEEKNIKVLKKVNLITPQNIHLNSFMYEPILDMSDEELKTLYDSVGTLS